MFARIPLLAALALLALALAHAHVAGAWPNHPVVVRAPVANLKTPFALADGLGGAFVAWCEDSTGRAGRVRAQHILGDGVLDPSWPDSGAIVRDSSAARTLLTMLDDSEGGFLLIWWEDNATLCAQHVLASGERDPRWPAGGRRVGTSVTTQDPPSFACDGGGGFYASWVSTAFVPTRVVLTRVLADGTTPTAWDAQRHFYPPPDASRLGFSPSIAVADDRGVFLAYDEIDVDFGVPDSAYYATQIQRMAASGAASNEWPSEGLTIGPMRFPTDVPRLQPAVRVARDGSQGIFVLRIPLDGWLLDSTEVMRFDRFGHLPLEWPEHGVVLPPYSTSRNPVVVPDGVGGLAIGSVVTVSLETDQDLCVERIGPTGSTCWDFVGGSLTPTLVPSAGAGFHAGAFDPSNWHNGIGGGTAGLHVRSFVPGNTRHPVAFDEFSRLAPRSWEYGEFAMAAAPDGGCFVFYEHVVAPEGLLAIRLSPSGQPLDVPLPSPAPGLEITSASWRNGVGVRMRCAIPAGASASLALHDLAGRVVARANDLAPRGSSDVVLAGTSRLVPGIYFVRLRQGAASAHARVVVIP